MPAKDIYELAYTATKDGKDCYYVYNCKSGGYVIVSADDRTVAPVLGYSTDGYFDYEKLGDNAKGWMDSYATGICAFDTLPPVTSKKMRKAPGKAVAPLLGDIAWDQGYPYNMMCPEIDGGNYPTGCVVTAAAQIMYYNQWPEHGRGIVSNGWDAYQTKIDLSESTYRWNLMQPNYDETSSPESKESVALLMRDLGYAVDAMYCITGTAADPTICAMKLLENFDYSPAITVYFRQYYYDEEWDNLVYEELNDNRPCLYSAFGPEGHTFVCDGYDTDGYFHFNFGWSGLCNGYYLSTSIMEFSNNQSIITGIMKNNGEEPVLNLCASDFYYSESSSMIYGSGLYIAALGAELKDDDIVYGVFIQNNSTKEVVFPFDNSLGWTGFPVKEKISYCAAAYNIGNYKLPDGDYNLYLGIGSKSKKTWNKAHFPNNEDIFITLTAKDNVYSYENKMPTQYEEGKVYINGIYFLLDDANHTACVTKKNEYSHIYHDDVIIPNTISIDGVEYKVTGIDEFAFYSCDRMNSVFIPQNVEYISKAAFSGSGLKSVVFEEGSKLKKIGHSAFYCCFSLEDINLPEGLNSIDSGAFNNCIALNSITIPESVDNIGESVFTLSVGKLKDISVKWLAPKEFDNAFDWGDKKVTLHVPAGTKELYAKTDCWSRFDIVEGFWSDKIKIGKFWYNLNNTNLTASFASCDDDDELGYLEEIHIPASIEYEGINYVVTQLGKKSLLLIMVLFRESSFLQQ